MRKEITDGYIDIALIGNNIYDMVFMKYLFLSQNVNSYYCDKYQMDIEEKVIEGRTHNNFNGHGVNELGDQFIKETYKQTVYQKQL